MGIEGWRRKAQDRPVKANSIGSQGSRRAVAPSGGGGGGGDDDKSYNLSFRSLPQSTVTFSFRPKYLPQHPILHHDLPM
jgi:hypothetical protein